MKKLALLSVRNVIGTLYYNDLCHLFEGYLEIDHVSVEQEKNSAAPSHGLKDADIVVITNPEAYSLFKDRVNPSAKIISLVYALLTKSIQTLRAFPRGSSALLYFSLPTMCYKLLSILFELGVNNLDLIAWDAAAPSEQRRYDLAIVDDYSPPKPPNANLIVNLGRRTISFMTLMQIAVEAGVLDHQLESRIFHYAQGQASTTDLLQSVYGNFTYLNQQMQAILNRIDSAVIILDEAHNIINYNRNFLQITGLRKDIRNKSISELPEIAEVAALIAQEEPPVNQLVHCRAIGRNLVVTREEIDQIAVQKKHELVLLKDMSEITRLEHSLRRQLTGQGYVARHTFADIEGESAAIRSCVEKAQKLARIDKTTLILGESGTGKELFAQSIHAASQRHNDPFVGINCAALPPSLLESELFGYTDGAFTGARKGGKAGLFELAHKGSLFLDEIGETSLELQSKLLRVIEEKEIMRIGGDRLISVDVRIIAATHQDLRQRVKEGRFRLDLYYRINAMQLSIPALHERREDIAPLIDLFRQNEDPIRPLRPISMQVMNFFGRYEWEGNIRELRNCVEYMVHIAGDETIGVEHLPDYLYGEWAYTNAPRQKEAVGLLAEFGREERRLISAILIELSCAPGGRAALSQRLRAVGIAVGEYRLRQMLAMLRERGLITFGRGSVGIVLTEAGAALVVAQE